MSEKPGNIMPHQLRHAVLGVLVEESRRLAVDAPQRLMNMRGTAGGIVVPLRKEGHSLALRPGDLLGGVLDDGVPVGHGQRIGVTNVDFRLAGGCFALGIFDRNAGALQALAQRPHDILFLGRLEDMIVFIITAGEVQPLVAVGARRIEGLVEQEELQFRRHIGFQPHGLQPRHLLFEKRARRMRHFFMGVMVKHVAQHQRRAFQPGHPP